MLSFFERLKVSHLMLAVVVFIVVPFFSWYGTWFGRPLTDQQLAEYLRDEKARKVQNALWKISERMQHGDRSVQPFYPRINELAASPVAEVRANVAWVMGQDNHAEAFHPTLLTMLGDGDPIVRRNAALSLVRFTDTTGRAEIDGMLHAFTVKSPAAGAISFRLKVEDSIGRGTLLGHIDSRELRSPVPGYFESMLVKDGAQVAVGDPVMTISPSEDQVWEALRALYLIGTADELSDINPYARGANHNMSQRVQQQAELTAAAIRKR